LAARGARSHAPRAACAAAASARSAQLPPRAPRTHAPTRPRTAPPPPPPPRARPPTSYSAARQPRIHPRCSGTAKQGHARYSECASASQLTNRTGAKQQQAEAEGRVSACGQRAGPAAPPSEQEQVLIKGVRTFQHRLKHTTVSTGVPTACPTLDQRRCAHRVRVRVRVQLAGTCTAER
jgi:hypothetical protein